MSGFYEHRGISIVKPGTQTERERARLGAARIVLRSGGGADDLRLVLDMLDLWPASDPALCGRFGLAEDHSASHD
jgi:hypothetical protein